MADSAKNLPFLMYRQKVMAHAAVIGMQPACRTKLRSVPQIRKRVQFTGQDADHKPWMPFGGRNRLRGAAGVGAPAEQWRAPHTHHISDSGLPLQSHSTTMVVESTCIMLTIKYHTPRQSKPCLATYAMTAFGVHLRQGADKTHTMVGSPTKHKVQCIVSQGTGSQRWQSCRPAMLTGRATKG